MKNASGPVLIICLVLCASLFPVPAAAFNVTIGDFGGLAHSTAGGFVGQVWVPIGDSNLDYADLLFVLGLGDVEVTTNGLGDITVNNFFDSNLAVNRQVTLTASGDISISGITATGAGALSVVTAATGTVTVDLEGSVLNGGSFTSSGTDFACSNAGLQTSGGNVALNHTGVVTLNDNAAVTGGGSFTSSGTNFTCSGGCIQTAGGIVSLNHTGAVTVGGGGAVTGGGPFTSSGTDFTCSGGCVQSTGGNVALNHTGVVTIDAGGALTGGGSFTSSGTDFACSGTCLQTTGGNVDMNHTGSALFTNGGVQTDGGTILVQADGLIDIDVFTTFTSGGASDGGDVTLISDTGITADSVIDTSPGAGGVLTLSGNKDAIVLNQAPVLGAGNIILRIESTPVPTLSEWGVIVLFLALSVIAVTAMRRKTGRGFGPSHEC